jgi:predicted GIY-YIG superfamily endonuclease
MQNAMKQPCVYIMASQKNGTLYTGVTSNLPRRAFEHREGLIDGFTRKYNCKLIVWYEAHETMEAAIIREKQIKAGSRKKKIRLIQSLNPEWGDLYDTLI